MTSHFESPEIFADALKTAWSINSSTSWTAGNPAKGQCSVTSLVAQDLFGGEIVTTRTKGGTHFYNVIDGRRHDFTISQFDYEITFDDTPSSRAEAFTDTSGQQYAALRQALGLQTDASTR
ncbi:hypothetical protein ABID16_003770 [Rhizobium aquaticum]|uniref:Polyketide cyclase n=1 Tax=Rhizobium aquaticum TaxID=1549636 RepID=A0ABV2J3V9_9HYPH